MAKVFFASDHAGFALKGALVEYTRGLGHEVEDLGAHSFDEGDDYPDFITPCAQRVAQENAHVGHTMSYMRAFGVVLGASGQGEAMAANRVDGVRAAVFYGSPPRPQTDAGGEILGMIESVRAHNDANVLSLGARFVSADEAREAVKLFLETPFSGGARHARRLAKF